MSLSRRHVSGAVLAVWIAVAVVFTYVSDRVDDWDGIFASGPAAVIALSALAVLLIVSAFVMRESWWICFALPLLPAFGEVWVEADCEGLFCHLGATLMMFAAFLVGPVLIGIGVAARSVVERRANSSAGVRHKP